MNSQEKVERCVTQLKSNSSREIVPRIIICNSNLFITQTLICTNRTDIVEANVDLNAFIEETVRVNILQNIYLGN